MGISVTNKAPGDFSVGGLLWKKGEVKVLTVLNKAIRDEIDKGVNLSSPSDATPITGLADITNTLTTFTNTTGVPQVPASGLLTLAAITDIATAANAIASLAAELNRVKTLNAALIARIELIENVVIGLEVNDVAKARAA